LIVRAGNVLQESRLGVLHIDRLLDPAQLELVCQAIDMVGWGPNHVTEVELTEAGPRVRYFGGDPRVSLTARPICPHPRHRRH